MKKTGIFAAVLLLLVTVQSTAFHFALLKVTFVEWLFFNACAPSNIVYLSGFLVYLIKNDKTFLYPGGLPMFFFGATGLYVFPWSGMAIIPQIAHILMLLNIAWLASATFREKGFKSAATGLIPGIFIFSFFIGAQQYYIGKHPDDFKRIIKMADETSRSLMHE